MFGYLKKQVAASEFIPNGVKETFDFVLTGNVDQAVIDNVFYGSLQTFSVGKYDRVSFWLDNQTAGPGESCKLRFGLYDPQTGDKIGESDYTVDENTVGQEEKVIFFPELVISDPRRLWVVFGKNDEIGGNFNVDSARADIPESANSNLVFTFSHPSGALPANILGIRAAGTRIFYNAIFKQG